MSKVTVVKIYITEGDDLQHKIMDYLHKTVKIRGATVLRGISGFGHSGAIHDNTLLYMSLDLPLVIEFFDVAEKITPAIEYLSKLIGERHMISWEANSY
jgi:hypothetical protein